MQLSYRGRQYTPASPEVLRTEQIFEGQLPGLSMLHRAVYGSSAPKATARLTYRDQAYLSDR